MSKKHQQYLKCVGMLNHSGQMGNGLDVPLRAQNVCFKFKPRKLLKSVKELSSFKKLDEVRLPMLESFDIVLIEY